ncbi:hypothetical protein BD413DRAFT_626358 [Trametes elegans]|nr:hypothetical protein BD413DRAFT_626358 [Trametes elegans]
MSFSHPANESISLASPSFPADMNGAQTAARMDVLFRGLLLAQLLGGAPDVEEDSENAEQQQGGSAGPSMPVPVAMQQPNLAGAPPMPTPQIFPQPAVQPGLSPCPSPSSGQPSFPPPSAPANPEPPRPPSPTPSDVAQGNLTWRVFTAPLYRRLGEALYDSPDSLPEPATGNVGYLKLDGYGARDTVECMCALTRFLCDHRWEAQGVDAFIAAQKPQPHWPAKLRDQSHGEHVKYAWMLMNGLLAVIGLKPYLEPAPPPTFAGVVARIYPALPSGVAQPARFWFTARELVEEDFIIQPTTNMLDHLKLAGNVVSVYVLATEQASLLMGYKRNKAAKAIGMTNLGNEILYSYGALVEGEFHENYRLPISLGIFKIDEERVRRGQYDDLTVVTGIIRMFHNDREADKQPQLLASRVLEIEDALRKRRHWYNRLRRDINKRKKTEPWMFWGAVLAVFFGVCTVIQTVTSVWSLVVSLGG